MSETELKILITALKDKAVELRDHDGCGLIGESYATYAGARESVADWLDELIGQIDQECQGVGND